jgi:glycosyltransferase involved in cell wall biosynthesis
LITRQTYRNASHLVTVGEGIKERLMSRWNLSSSHISVVTNGAHIDHFMHPRSFSDCRQRYGIGSGPVIIFVGGFQPWHGVDLILEGFRHIASTIANAVIIFVGEGPLRSHLQQMSAALKLDNKVIFTGRVEHAEISQLLRIADIAVIYHRRTAAKIVETPLKLFEYMAAGKAIVAPDVPNMRRILTDKLNALLVPPDDPAALAASLLQLIADPLMRESLGMAAQKDAIEKHSWDRAVSQLETILYSLLREECGR